MRIGALSSRASLRNPTVFHVLSFAASLLIVMAMLTPRAMAQDAPGFAPPPSQAPAPQEPPPASREARPQQIPQPSQAIPLYDKAIFQKPIPGDQLAFLKQFAGAPADDLIRDKQYRKLLHQVIPDCTFHYGSDKPLDSALDEVLQGSREPVLLHQERYLLVSGQMGPYLAGRGFMWIDLQDGIALGGFYFHPTNGEPTPTVTIFSRQIKERAITMGELPLAFADDLRQWTRENRIPPLTTRYFITGLNKRILLEHDENYCALSDSTSPPDNACEQIEADAADIDVDTASYLEQVHYATNATAWMITDPEQIAWVRVRDRTCGGVLDPLGCHIRMTRERIHVILHRPSTPHPEPHPIHR